MPTLFVDLLLDPPDEVSDPVLSGRPPYLTRGGAPCPDIIDQANDGGHHQLNGAPPLSLSMRSAAAPAG